MHESDPCLTNLRRHVVVCVCPTKVHKLRRIAGSKQPSAWELKAQRGALIVDQSVGALENEGGISQKKKKKTNVTKRKSLL